MSTVMVQDTDISITRFCLRAGVMAYQVTWRSSDKEHLFDYVCLETWEEAEQFISILRNRVKRNW